jgi:hypothetical protein
MKLPFAALTRPRTLAPRGDEIEFGSLKKLPTRQREHVHLAITRKRIHCIGTTSIGERWAALIARLAP